MTCKDCMYCNECIMSEPDGRWKACDDFVEKCDGDCELVNIAKHCEYMECPLDEE